MAKEHGPPRSRAAGDPDGEPPSGNQIAVPTKTRFDEIPARNVPTMYLSNLPEEYPLLTRLVLDCC